MIKKFLKFTALLLTISAISVSISSCKKELNPELSNVQVCIPPSSGVLCTSNQTTFSPTDSEIRISATAKDIEKSNTVSFAMYFQVNGEWQEILTDSSPISALGDFDDEIDELDLNYTFNAGTQMWNEGQWRLTMDINSDMALSTEKIITVEN